MTYHSQHDEERYILEFFKDQPAGTFLDVGAFNGVTLSNTYCLVRKGWHGVAVEPGPRAFVQLLANYEDYPVRLVNAAITLDGRLVQFRDGEVYSTLSERNYHRWKSFAHWTQPFYIPTLSLKNFGDTFGWDYDFISIDAEGESLVLALALPLKQCERVKMLCIEHDGHEHELIEYFRPFSFRRLAYNAENLILVR
jgi:FkbM family methyltransferase